MEAHQRYTLFIGSLIVWEVTMIGNTIEYRIDIADLVLLMRIGLVKLMVYIRYTKWI